MTSVRLSIFRDYPYSHCRACDKRVLWFAVWRVRPEYGGEDDRVSEVSFNQVGHENRPCYCPYCGEKKLYLSEDDD